MDVGAFTPSCDVKAGRTITREYTGFTRKKD
jgi:hypothetical protein